LKTLSGLVSSVLGCFLMDTGRLCDITDAGDGRPSSLQDHNVRRMLA